MLKNLHFTIFDSTVHSNNDVWGNGIDFWQICYAISFANGMDVYDMRTVKTKEGRS